jgi:hypothetical protein
VLRKSSMIASSQVFKAKFSDSGLMRSSLHKSQLVLWDVMEPDSLDEHSNDSPVADQWISDEVVELLEGERDRAFDSSQRSAAVGDASAFGESQNQAMLLKFFLEQARGSVPPRQKTRALVDRDFGRWENFRASWTALAIPPAVQWIVLGLSFAGGPSYLTAVLRFPDFMLVLNRRAASQNQRRSGAVHQRRVVGNRLGCSRESDRLLRRAFGCLFRSSRLLL